MPSSFNDAFDFLIKSDVEGELSDLKDDRGGLTKFGLSERTYPNLDIRNLTKDDAKKIYQKDWWSILYNDISSQKIVNALFITIINVGARPGHILMQKAINVLIKDDIEVDGLFGLETLDALNKCDPDQLLNTFTLILIQYYYNLDVGRGNNRLTSYLRGWVRRALICNSMI